MSRKLDDLDPRFRSTVFEFLARCTEEGILVMIICTGRTAAEQAEAVRTGHSKVTHSLHQDGLAIDICPYGQYILHGESKLSWTSDDPIWAKLGLIGMRLGMRWGGTFTPLDKNGLGWDPGHFEYQERGKQ